MEFLKEALGEELYQKVMEALSGNDKVQLVNGADGSFLPRAKFNELNDQVKSLNTEFAGRDEQLEGLKQKAGGNEELLQSIEELKAKNGEMKAEYEGKLQSQTKDHQLEQAIASAGAKNAKAIMALLDMEAVTFVDGQFEGLEEQLEALKESDGYLFKELPSRGGANPAGGGNHASKDPGAEMNKLIRGAFGKPV